MSSHHHEGHSPSQPLTIEDKLIRMLEHWIHHNEEHAESYRKWQAQAQAGGLHEVAASLNKAVQTTESMNQLFRQALENLRSSPPS